GVIVDSNHHGRETVPYGFGRRCSDRTFGHGGAQCAIGFCDPARQLVVAWSANGFCGEGQHQRRNRAINDAIYADLGL
ncbi:MAG: serine hydrolase, partial [Planctomycetaceae bacterium]|nr:serine hydrolase [Planctomycetaceae bacterium]